ncbi:ChuX/HutX family heme-like substrate-binding protein [Neisseria perflava]|uniref:ChuX/HutX family heme-like substrate-binding protein n=1 Tax=Neisseria perflava TaxID=33053 RepID=UPI00209C955C|nr:ChuX/HutX family heme-like substrate-binding protein [Neisseria perflava]MCP1659780.1 putative hemin transport protein [Neisseria perflava]MCP1771621.1 putative hemin transport protein [Neisseria perflava]
MGNLWQQYQSAKTTRQGMYFPREGAADLGVSEGELLADAPDTVYLGGNIRDIVSRLAALGRVQCVVRNEVCVHEKQGVYENVSLAPSAGMALNIGGIDLRIFPGRWKHALAVTDKNGEKISRSIQFYDEFGVAVQKVFLRDEAVSAAWDELLAQFAVAGKSEFVRAELLPVDIPAPLSAERIAAFQERWLELKDVHHFGGLLENFHLDRLAAYPYAPAGMAVAVGNEVWQQALEMARDSGIEIMIFAGNRGVVQIQTGKVHNLIRARGYLNVLDGKEEGFSMHLKDDEIAASWIVRRPIRDGFVTCIEGFDSRRRTVIQIFGRRTEGQGELPQWTAITDTLMAAALQTAV